MVHEDDTHQSVAHYKLNFTVAMDLLGNPLRQLPQSNLDLVQGK